MRLAVISDIHGNLAALEAVLSDIKQKNVDTVCCAGDLVGYGPFPDEVIDLLRENQISSVMGNYDYAIGNSRIVCRCEYKDEEAALIGMASIQWTLESISEKNKEFLQRLPFEIDVGTDNYSVRVVHGSPRRNYEYLHENMDEKALYRLLLACRTDVLVCGHTHLPFTRRIGDMLLVNSGSVGKPKHGNPQASYCIVEINGKTDAEICYVKYDFEATAKAIIERGLPAKLAENIRTGQG